MGTKSVMYIFSLFLRIYKHLNLSFRVKGRNGKKEENYIYVLKTNTNNSNMTICVIGNERLPKCLSYRNDLIKLIPLIAFYDLCKLIIERNNMTRAMPDIIPNQSSLRLL